VDVDLVVTALRGADLQVLLLSLVAKAAGMVALAARSRIVMRGVAAVDFGGALRGHLLGLGGNAVLPIRLGEVLRAGYFARRSGAPLSSCLVVVASERALDAFWLLLVFIAVLPLALKVGAPAGLVAVAVVLAAALGVAFLVGRASASAAGGKTAPAGFAPGQRLAGAAATAIAGLRGVGSPGRLVMASALTLVYWLTSAGAIVCWLRGFHLDLPWHAPLVVLGFIAFGAALPAAPGFVGTYHLFAARGVGLYGVEPSTAAAFAVAGHFLAVVPFALLAVALTFDELIRAWRERAPAARAR